MEYGYGFDDESPRFALSSLWFLLGVIVFAFSVLGMAAIVTAGSPGGYYLNVQQPSQQTRPVTNSAGVTTTVASTPTPVYRSR